MSDANDASSRTCLLTLSQQRTRCKAPHSRPSQEWQSANGRVSFSERNELGNPAAFRHESSQLLFSVDDSEEVDEERQERELRELDRHLGLDTNAILDKSEVDEHVGLRSLEDGVDEPDPWSFEDGLVVQEDGHAHRG